MVSRFKLLLVLCFLIVPEAEAATCGDVLDGKVSASDPTFSAENRQRAFNFASKILAKDLLESLQEKGAQNGFFTVLDVYTNKLAPFRDSVEEAWLGAENESGGPIELLREICTNRHDAVFTVYIRAYQLMYINRDD